jgi:hypothetical protein
MRLTAREIVICTLCAVTYMVGVMAVVALVVASATKG